MPYTSTVDWLLASFLSWTGFRVDILFVRVVRAGAVFVGVALAVSPLAPRLASPDVRLDARAVIDTTGYSVDEDEYQETRTAFAFGVAA